MNLFANKIDISEKIADLANQIYQDCPDPDSLVIIGIQRRGVQLSERIAAKILATYKKEIPLGILDITFYRDDLSMVSHQPIVHSTDIPFDLENKYVVLIDDVIYTGRTARAALDALVDFGRAKIVRLGVLVDRGWREFPIQPDYVGWKIKTNQNQVVHVCVEEIDGKDEVVLTKNK